MQETQRQLTENEKEIIKLGRANNRLNKHCIKVCLPPFIVSVVLILLYGLNIWHESAVMIAGILILFIDACIPVVWFISLTIRASKIGYTHQRYQELIKNYETHDNVAEPIENNSHQFDCETPHEESKQNK